MRYLGSSSGVRGWCGMGWKRRHRRDLVWIMDASGSSRTAVKRACALARLISDMVSSISPISRISSVGSVRMMAEDRSVRGGAGV